MIRMIAHIALASLLTAGCAVVPKVNTDGATEVKIGQQADLGGPKVTVLRVLEDSRCPVDVNCVWAGRVKLSVRIELGSSTSIKELASNEPLQVADGMLELTGTKPAKSTQREIAPGDYRFALKFSGGL